MVNPVKTKKSPRVTNPQGLCSISVGVVGWWDLLPDDLVRLTRLPHDTIHSALDTIDLTLLLKSL